MGKCLLPLKGETPWIVPSLRPWVGDSGDMALQSNITASDDGGEDGCIVPNPTVVPLELLSGFHFTFLIRNPRSSIPSLWQCSTPPKSLLTGWHGFKAEDAGYKDMRRLFDYLVRVGLIGPGTGNEICVVDTDDLLTHPEDVVSQFCASIGVSFDPGMLRWDSDSDQKRAQEAFKNWAPFHDAVLKSTSLTARPSECLNFSSCVTMARPSSVIIIPPPPTSFGKLIVS
jgi:hypothetical protein